MQTTPRVSIIVRTKNRPLFLKRALLDISAQIFSDVEILLVNDGGDPHEVDRIVELSPWKKRTTVIHNESSLGMENASNLAISRAQGEFICIHDDDDTWHARFLHACVEHLDEHPKDAAVGVRTEIIWERLEKDQIITEGREIAWPEIRAITFNALLRQNQAVPISCLYRASIIEQLGGFRADLPVVGDWDFHLRLARYHNFAFIDGMPLAFWHQRKGQTGVAGNSVIAMSGAHAYYDALVRREYLGDELSDNQVGQLLVQGAEFQFLRSELAMQMHLVRELSAQVTSLHTKLDEQSAHFNEQNNWLLHKADNASLYAVLRRLAKKLLRKGS
ncbi:glycosyltransferase family 2 protein [Boudabousia marimammalium]|uniref:Glycosyltransferase 2-like domain-containing protein n=1 Tax=Boudabousia marimammalium TaxID=156892 RepID=A0A1Q5PRL4_9ACTO|nr:glycosyltransferase family 2 protein [Boudabousia marimammalium]OKL50217.1 hypothetical protein BM477_02150 [Boudabousia marimammalium]